jgi:hypothetical protein
MISVSQTRMLLETKSGTNESRPMKSFCLCGASIYHEKGPVKKENLLLQSAEQMIHGNSKKDAMNLCIISGSNI